MDLTIRVDPAPSVQHRRGSGFPSVAIWVSRRRGAVGVIADSVGERGLPRIHGANEHLRDAPLSHWYQRCAGSHGIRTVRWSVLRVD